MFHIEGMCFFSNQLPAIGYRFGWQPMARQPDFLQHFSSHQTHFHAEVRFSVWRNFPVDSSPKLRLEIRRDQRQPNQKMADGLPSTGRHSSRKRERETLGCSGYQRVRCVMSEKSKKRENLVDHIGREKCTRIANMRMTSGSESQ